VAYNNTHPIARHSYFAIPDSAVRFRYNRRDAV
jgi:hypothetical protein